MSDPSLALDALPGWLTENPEFDPLNDDLLGEPALERLHWTELESERMLHTVRAYQRAYRVEPSHEGATALLRLGFASAQAIARTPRASFVSLCAEHLIDGVEHAESAHRRATRIAEKTTHMWATVSSNVAVPSARALRLNPTAQALADAFRPLPSYQEMFGSLDYYSYQECDSMLGPAAYLVDLLRILDEYVTKPNTATIPEGLSFDERRPDIAQIPLSCEQTDKLLPYLKIVDERLVATARIKMGVASEEAVWERLATLHYPFALPFNLPLSQLRILLGSIGVKLAAFYEAWNQPTAQIARETLALSRAQYTLIATSLASSEEALAACYGIAKDELESLAQVDTFLARTGLDVEALRALVYQDLSDHEVREGIAQTFFVNRGLATEGLYLRIGEGESAGKIENLGVDPLDRVNRFIRLAAMLGWSYVELDWALHAVCDGEPELNDQQALIVGLAQLSSLATRLKLSVVRTSSLLAQLKTYGSTTTTGATQFDEVFNAPAQIGAAAAYHPKGDIYNPTYQDEYRAWTVTSTSDADQTIAGWLAGSLGVSVDALRTLAGKVFTASPVLLDVPALSTLYRHATLMRTLGLNVDRYLIVLRAAGLSATTRLTSENLDALVDVADWLKQRPIDVYTLDYVLNGTPSPYVKVPYKPTDVAAWLTSLSKQLQNTPPSGQDETPREEQLFTALTILFGCTREAVEPSMALAGKCVELPWGLTRWQEVFLTSGGEPSPYRTTAEELLGWASRWLVLGATLTLAPTLLHGVAVNPDAYGFSRGPASIDLEKVRDLSAYQAFMSAFQDSSGGLLEFASALAKKLPLAKQAELIARVTDWDLAQVRALLNTVAAGATNAADVLSALGRCFELTGRLDCDVAFAEALADLAQVEESQWNIYQARYAAVRHQIASLYETAEWASNSARLDGQIAAAKRDALLPFVHWKLSSIYRDIHTERNVYEYMLIEVQTGPTVEISYIVEATNAAQLYLQRCRLRLEIGVDKLEIPEVWWTWMMNFRVWQANRRVFLYPENYLLPSVRRTKTSLFEELESELQQSQITETYVAEAYTSYFTVFHEVAKLKPVNCYHCTVDGPRGAVDTLFLFARTEASPPTFYYCTNENGVRWSEWRKINLSINSQNLTPLYAFNRLFLFWSELKISTNSKIAPAEGGAESSNSTVWKLSINYSFLDQNGKWAPPQSLGGEQVVNYRLPENTQRSNLGPSASIPESIEPNPFGALLNMDDPIWQKVYLMKTSALNLIYAQGASREVEKISVLCGPILREFTASSYEPTPEPQGQDPDDTAFLRLLYERAVDLNSLVLARGRGYLSYSPPVNIDVNLQDNYVLGSSEFLILSSDGNTSPNPTVRMDVDSVDDLLQVLPSSAVIYDNYLGDVDQGYVRPVLPQALTTSVLEHEGLPPATAAAIPPLLQTGGLLDTRQRVVRPFNSSTDIAGPLARLRLSSTQLEQVRRAMFVTLGTFVPLRNISPVNGRLVTVKNQPGWAQFDNGDESFLLRLPPRAAGAGKLLAPFQTIEQATAVRRPLLSPSSFEIAQVSPPDANRIYKTLVVHGLIDENDSTVYELAQEVVGTDEFTKILREAQQGLNEDQITAVGNVLLNTPFAKAYSFVSPSIGKETAEKIVTKFTQYSLIDQTGRATTSLLSSSVTEKVLGQMIVNGQIKRDQVPDIYKALASLGAPVEFAYENEGIPALTSVWDYDFEVIRTSTAAVDRLSRRLFARGVTGLLELEAQQIPVLPILPFERFAPDPYNLSWPAAIDGAQVDFQGVYGPYFWEVFFHTPMLVANSLSSNQQFAAAERWFRYVLDPTAPEQLVTAQTFVEQSAGAIGPGESQTICIELENAKPTPILEPPGHVSKAFTAKTSLGFLLKGGAGALVQSIVRNVLLNHQVASDVDHFWQFQPFRNTTLESLREMLADDNPAIEVYENEPFDPHAIAALRIGAYEKSVLMQYVQNLIAWGDSLFMQESFESITQATMLYVYAFDLLGEKPVDLGPPPKREPITFAQIRDEYPEEIPRFLIELEHTLEPPGPRTPTVDESATPFNALNTYFCFPENDQLLRMWDTLEDRLFKIRNSMNIDGEVRRLPLFAPALNPLDLIKAGAGESGFLPAAESSAEIPPYRFDAMLERARGVTSQVSEFGAKLLAALEKQDAEELALLHSTQEGQILAMMSRVRQDAIGDLTETIAGLQANLKSAEDRVAHYQALISAGLNASENTNLDAMAASLAFTILATGLRAAATIAYTIPQVGSPFAMTYGGVQIGSALTAASSVAEIGGDVSNFIASRSLTMAGYKRRAEDWKLAEQDAQHDVTSLTKQIAAAQARLDGARRELALNGAEITQNAQVYEYLKDKFTSKDLYQWMVSRIAVVYFQAYRLALELALAAQQSYRFELGCDESFLSFNYWDNLHRGLMAGENLSFALAQMEASHLSKNTRRLEIERSVSLAMWDPKALWELKSSGKCLFQLTEELFDYDYPGHYNRQLKSVSVSIPAVIGPYENFKATLGQTYSAVATTTEAAPVEYLLDKKKPKPKSGLHEGWAPKQQIAISRGIDDAGVFELDFHDERYLPFEGTGAVSDWELKLPQSSNRFDLNAIGDVILTVRYTAIDGSEQICDGRPYVDVVKQLLHENPLPGATYLSLAQAYQTQWGAFMVNHSRPDDQDLSFDISPRAGYLAQATLTEVYVKLQTVEVAIPDGAKFLSASCKGLTKEFALSGGVGQILGLEVPQSEFSGPWTLAFDLRAMRLDAKLALLLDANKQYIDPAKLLNAELILIYESNPF